MKMKKREKAKKVNGDFRVSILIQILDISMWMAHGNNDLCATKIRYSILTHVSISFSLSLFSNSFTKQSAECQLKLKRTPNFLSISMIE